MLLRTTSESVRAMMFSKTCLYCPNFSQIRYKKWKSTYPDMLGKSRLEVPRLRGEQASGPINLGEHQKLHTSTHACTHAHTHAHIHTY